MKQLKMQTRKHFKPEITKKSTKRSRGMRVLIVFLAIFALSFLGPIFFRMITGKAILASPSDGTSFSNTRYCNDTDGGVFFGVKGSVYIKPLHKDEAQYNDSCNSLGRNLIEYYCKGNRYASVTKLCKSGCVDSACISDNAVEKCYLEFEIKETVNATMESLNPSQTAGATKTPDLQTHGSQTPAPQAPLCPLYTNQSLTARASSYTRAASNAVDNNPHTIWGIPVNSLDGLANEWLEFTMNDSFCINGINITIGAVSDIGIYNYLPIKFDVIVRETDLSPERIILSNATINKSQEYRLTNISFNQSIRAKSVKIKFVQASYGTIPLPTRTSTIELSVYEIKPYSLPTPPQPVVTSPAPPQQQPQTPVATLPERSLPQEPLQASFSIISMSNLYGDYAHMVKSYSPDDQPNFIIMTKNKTGAMLGKYSAESSRFVFWDDFSGIEPSGGIEELNESAFRVIVPFDVNLYSLAINDTISGKITNLRLLRAPSCKRTCKLENEGGRWGEIECCAGLQAVQKIGDYTRFVCVRCGDGVCSANENAYSCSKDCMTQ
jgi:hypothetical protein